MKHDKARICGVDYKIVTQPFAKMPEDLGLCHSDTQEIWLNEINTRETNINTLLHECLHAISNAYDIELTERQVNVGATALIAFARENPELIKYFFSNQKSND
jgi:Zn-dependent peptidase ImmA (M78 family)